MITRYLHPDLVDILKEWLDNRKPKPDEILFPISKENGGKDRRTAHMIAYDLNSARHFWIVETDTEEEKHNAPKNNFKNHVWLVLYKADPIVIKMSWSQ